MEKRALNVVPPVWYLAEYDSTGCENPPNFVQRGRVVITHGLCSAGSDTLQSIVPRGLISPDICGLTPWRSLFRRVWFPAGLFYRRLWYHSELCSAGSDSRRSLFRGVWCPAEPCSAGLDIPQIFRSMGSDNLKNLVPGGLIPCRSLFREIW